MNGKEKAALDERFKQLYKRYYSSIYKFCLSRIKDNPQTVEDITQEVFIVLYDKMRSGITIDYPQAFLLKTADNYIKRYYKELTRNHNVHIDEVINIPDQSKDLDAKLSFEEYSRQFSAALSEDDAELFSLRYIEELTIQEIAEITGQSVQNTATRLYRIREKLRKLFGEKIDY